jgi:hypothetical protein
VLVEGGIVPAVVGLVDAGILRIKSDLSLVRVGTLFAIQRLVQVILGGSDTLALRSAKRAACCASSHAMSSSTREIFGYSSRRACRAMARKSPTSARRGLGLLVVVVFEFGAFTAPDHLIVFKLNVTIFRHSNMFA